MGANIKKGDRTAARTWHARNFTFFDAPVAMILTTDRRLGLGALIDVGMFLEALIVAVRAFGLETCTQAAFGAYHAVARRELALAIAQLVAHHPRGPRVS